jgi:hypothetical protein
MCLPTCLMKAINSSYDNTVVFNKKNDDITALNEGLKQGNRHSQILFDST